jgi:23S rRNA pseudouridine2605 synthase
MMLIRINKYLADSGAASRRKAEEYIVEGRVEINGRTITDLSYKVDPEKDQVSLDGERLQLKKHVYILMNKPAGVVTTTSDERKRKTVIDLLDIKDKVYPVGRLDYNTTGVLILTNDGDFANMIAHPRHKVPRVYEVKINRPLSHDDREKLLKGIFLETGRGVFKEVSFPKHGDYTRIEVTSVEGRNHFVKNMFGALSYTVTALNRKNYAGLSADIPPGAYRYLTEKEIEGLRKKYGK